MEPPSEVKELVAEAPSPSGRTSLIGRIDSD